jgi:hypothetical protein
MAFIVKRDAVVISAGIPVGSTNNIKINWQNISRGLITMVRQPANQTGVRSYNGGDDYTWSVGPNRNFLAEFFGLSGYGYNYNIELVAPNNYSSIATPYELGVTVPYWRLIYWEVSCSDGDCSWNLTNIVDRTDATSPDYVPNTNWSPSITITTD